MGRTLPTITQLFHQQTEALSRFRRGLRRSDQLVLDDLLTARSAPFSGSCLCFRYAAV
jgi:DNA replication protein DnaC